MQLQRSVNEKYVCPHRPTFIAIDGYLSIFTILMTQISKRYVNCSLKLCLKSRIQNKI